MCGVWYAGGRLITMQVAVNLVALMESSVISSISMGVTWIAFRLKHSETSPALTCALASSLTLMTRAFDAKSSSEYDLLI